LSIKIKSHSFNQINQSSFFIFVKMLALLRGKTPFFSALGILRNYSSKVASDCYINHLSGEDQGISVLTLNRPEAKNALSKSMLAHFKQALDDLRFSSDVRVVIVKSEVDGVFCAGADLKERLTMPESDVAAFVYGIRASFSDLESLPMPTIAAIDGAALGGGLEMALACDLRVGGAKAKIGLTETKLAIIPGAGGTQRLPRIVGLSTAKRLIFTGKALTSTEAKAINLVDYEAPNAYDKALEVARDILPQGPIALRMAKLAINKGLDVDKASGLAFEQTCYAQVIPTQDRIEGLKAFREKRKPVYQGK